jgi:hypothetical protein
LSASIEDSLLAVRKSPKSVTFGDSYCDMQSIPKTCLSGELGRNQDPILSVMEGASFCEDIKHLALDDFYSKISLFHHSLF